MKKTGRPLKGSEPRKTYSIKADAFTWSKLERIAKRLGPKASRSDAVAVMVKGFPL